jgi:hypothetical protein
MVKHTPEEIAMLEEIAASALTVADTLAHLVDDAEALPDPARLALWALMFAAAPLAREDPAPAWVAPADRRVGKLLNDAFAKERKPKARRRR